MQSHGKLLGRRDTPAVRRISRSCCGSWTARSASSRRPTASRERQRPEPSSRERQRPEPVSRERQRPELGELKASATGAPGQKYYQLTHDYLVPSLREWLTRKQKETRRGRAEMRLAERAASWNAKPENRHLPAWWEWLNIRLFTRKKDWTSPQRKMMRKAARYHAVRGVVLAVLLVAVTLAGLIIRGQVVERNEGHPCRRLGSAAPRRGHRPGARHHQGDEGLSPAGPIPC